MEIFAIYSKRYDFEKYIDQHKKIIYLYFIPRSGSNFLAATMRETGKLGYPLEYFLYAHIAHWSKRFMDNGSTDVLDSMLKYRTSPNGVFSFKWNAWFPDKFKPMFEQMPVPKYNIFIDRRDRTRQAESFFIAQKFGDWLGSRDDHDYELSISDIRETLGLLSNLRDNTLKMLSDDNREYLAIDYEDFIINVDGTIKKILDFVAE